MSEVRIIGDADYIDADGESIHDEHVVRVSVQRPGKISLDIPLRVVRREGTNLVLEFDQVELAQALAIVRAKA